MAKGKTAQKWTKKDAAPVEPAFRITGGVLNGYVVVDRNGEPVTDKIENMWDAINTRDELLGRG